MIPGDKIIEYCTFTGDHPDNGNAIYHSSLVEARLFQTVSPHRRVAQRVVYYQTWEILDDPQT